jgi:hypothetical protein
MMAHDDTMWATGLHARARVQMGRFFGGLFGRHVRPASRPMKAALRALLPLTVSLLCVCAMRYWCVVSQSGGCERSTGTWAGSMISGRVHEFATRSLQNC